MDSRRKAYRIGELGRILQNWDSPVLGDHFGNTITTSKIINILVAIQGQNIVKNSYLKSLSYSGYYLDYLSLKNTYLPLFQEWGFIDIYDDRIEEIIKSRSQILDKAYEFWCQHDPHDAEKLAVDIFDPLSLAPLRQDKIENISRGFGAEIITSANTHLYEAGIIDYFPYKDESWYYSPEIFGEDYPNIIKYISNQTDEIKKDIYGLIEFLRSNQGMPEKTLAESFHGDMVNQLASSGITNAYPLIIDINDCKFFFTQDIRNSFEVRGKGDQFDLIKLGISHFRYAHHLAITPTGRLNLSPHVFLDHLIENGRSKSPATAIGRDYNLMVQKGLIKIEKADSSNRYYMVLPDSREKIADLQAIRDAFEYQEVVPAGDSEIANSLRNAKEGDSIRYRSRSFVKNRELSQQFIKDIYLL